MEKIIIYLHAADLTRPSWVLVNAQGVLQKVTPQGDIAALTVDAANKDAIVIAPPEAVILSAAKLPKLSRQRMLQALPFALEEQLLTDIGELHFAAGEYQANNTLPVAIVNKTKMAAWLSMLQDAGIAPSYLIPAPLTLPFSDQDWHIQVRDHSAIVRTGWYSGFGCDKQNLETFIQLNFAEQAEKPQRIYVLNSSAFHTLAKQADLKDLVKEQSLTDKQQFAEILRQCETPAINLMQGEFQPRRKASHNKKIWLLATVIAAAWLAVVLLSNMVSYFILQHESSKIEAAINAIYKQNFPQAKSMVAPKQRMTEKLDSLTNQNHKNRLLIWLAAIGKSINPANTIKIQQLDYRNNQLNLDITAPNFDSVDNFTQTLIQKSLSVKQQNVAAAGSQVKGALIITEGNQS